MILGRNSQHALFPSNPFRKPRFSVLVYLNSLSDKWWILAKIRQIGANILVCCFFSLMTHDICSPTDGN